MSSMLKLIRDLHPIRSGFVCDGADQVAKRLCQELPFQVHEFASGNEVNGWLVPWKWECQRATIHDANGNLIFNGNSHPLGVASYSDSFVAGIGGAELKKHLYWSETFDDAYIFHTEWWYKPHTRSWGMCCPKKIVDTIGDRDAYHVELRTTLSPGTMKVCEYVLPGKTETSIILSCHTDHPGCANDDLSGVAVGIEVMRFLQTVPDRRYTYRLVCAGEHIGPVFYLNRFGGQHIRYALFLESLGTTGPLALQHSFHGNTAIDVALKNVLRSTDHYTGAFRTIVGNCETVWDSAGHEIPCPSLSRAPFKEYHTSYDNPDLMDEGKLDEAVWAVSGALAALEKDATMERHFTGLVCLGSPKFDLYKSFFDPSIPERRTIDAEAANWNKIMNHLPRHMDRNDSLLDLAEKFGVKFCDLYEYVRQWQDRGLLTMHPEAPVFSGVQYEAR